MRLRWCFFWINRKIQNIWPRTWSHEDIEPKTQEYDQIKTMKKIYNKRIRSNYKSTK